MPVLLYALVFFMLVAGPVSPPRHDSDGAWLDNLVSALDALDRGETFDDSDDDNSTWTPLPEEEHERRLHTPFDWRAQVSVIVARRLGRSDDQAPDGWGRRLLRPPSITA